MNNVGYNATHIAGASAGTVASPRRGILRRVAVNKLVNSGTITVYDNAAASGVVLAIITLPADVTGLTPFFLDYDVAYETGLTIVTTGALDVTVAWN